MEEGGPIVDGVVVNFFEIDSSMQQVKDQRYLRRSKNKQGVAIHVLMGSNTSEGKKKKCTSSRFGRDLVQSSKYDRKMEVELRQNMWLRKKCHTKEEILDEGAVDKLTNTNLV